MAGILCQKITRRFQTASSGVKTALDGLDLHVADREFVCLLGPSGCGKSTLLNILAGLDTHYSGSVAFTGFPEGNAQKEPAIGYVFQTPRLLPWLSVEDNVRFVLHGLMSRTQANGEAASWLRRVGLGGFEHYYPAQLSVGMQQRVGVARALAIRPQVLLMDEPFSALDELTALKMRGELLDLREALSCTVVFVTHNPLEAAYLADRVLVMQSGVGRITDALSVELPRPRDAEDPRLWELARNAVGRLRTLE